MTNYKKTKRTLIALMIISSVIMQGCSDEKGDREVTVESLSTIPLHVDESAVSVSDTVVDQSSENTDYPSDADYNDSVNVQIDMEEHIFFIDCDYYEENPSMEGSILTYEYPETANVYAINYNYSEWDPFYDPIEEWQYVSFPSTALLLAIPVYNDDMTSYSQLSRSEINSVVDSMRRVSTDNLEQIDIIRSAFEDAVYGDYYLRSTFPAVESDLYQITAYDPAVGEEVIVDTIRDRNIDLTVLRRVVDGISLGTPNDIDLYYTEYNDDDKTEMCILSDVYDMFYDGTDLYEIHAGYDDMDVYLQDQPLISLDRAMELAVPAIADVLSDSSSRNWETRVYATELVYLTVQISDMSNVDYYHDDYIVRDSFELYLYPFWVVYIHSNYVDGGMECAQRKPILINAVTEEIFICN